MQLTAALIYWVIVSLWAIVLATIVTFYLRNPRAFGTARLLLGVLAIDTTRNLVENIYFGAYFGSRYGLFPASIGDVLGAPHLLIIPKVLNVIAGVVVLALLLRKWLPAFSRDVAVLQAFADTDPLTQLLNRRSFLTFGQDAVEHYRRYGRPFAVLMIDIDHFKGVNDTYGHAVGDIVLERVASTIKTTLRPTDKVARFGGEEFVVLLREIAEADVVTTAERVRSAIASLAVHTEHGDMSVTASLGWTITSDAAEDIAQVIERADLALYSAKTQGRNRVMGRPPQKVIRLEGGISPEPGLIHSPS
jgi:diguanylate cyclase (GGDEF)-like protein